jgi:N-acetyl-gamma-glutamyl-phosphate reductase
VARVAVLGAAGYAGAVAAALVHRHPYFELAHVTARSDAGARLDEVHPRTRVPLALEAPSTELDVDAAIVAYPHGASAPAVAALLERGIRVIDLSADFRLRDRGTYERWYGEHGAPDLVGEAVYGLPERYREQIRDARLIANPGCYPTAAILALAPLADAGVLGEVIIDAKSGVSGAGREPSHTKHFVSVDETVTPYKVGAHRHTPEIEQELGGGLRVSFTPHLVPLSYGELVSCYVIPAREADAAALLREAYADEPWVEVSEAPPGMHEVRETNFCRISAHEDPAGRLIVFATIDNLYKGTSSQAVQNLNLMFGRDESEGLPG